MRRIFLSFFGLFLIAGFTLASPLLYGPWTGAPDRTSITISWVASPPTPATIRYGPLPLYRMTGELPFSFLYAAQSSGEWEIVHTKLENLEPSTWYVYRLVFPGGEETPIGTFRTAPEPGEPITFAVISDTQWQWAGMNRVQLVAEAMACDGAAFHFVLHGGDLVETPIPEHWQFFFTSLGPILRWAPLIPVLGNHERDSLSYYRHFTLPPGGGRLGKRWWALHWGDVVIVGLDSNAKSPRDYHEQVEWLRQSLSGPEPYKFVIFHHPVFSSDAIYYPGVEGLQTLWHPVFVELGVNIVFTGHAHNYERIERDGVTYLVVGGGGATLRPLAEKRVEGSQIACDEHHFYVRVRTSSEGIEVQTVKVARQLDGEIIRTWGILDAFGSPKVR